MVTDPDHAENYDDAERCNDAGCAEDVERADAWRVLVERDPQAITAVRLWRATNLVQRRIEAALRPIGLTQTQVIVLLAVANLALDGPRVRLTDVMGFAALDPNLASQVIVRLERQSLIERHPDPNDRRARLLALTEAGRAAIMHAVPLMDAAHEAAFAMFDPSERDRLHELLGGMLRSDADDHE